MTLVQTLAFLAPAIVGLGTFLAVQGAKRASRWLDTRSATFKRTAVVVVSASLAALAEAVGAALPAECAGGFSDACASALASPVFLRGFLGALVAYALHFLKTRPAK